MTTQLPRLPDDPVFRDQLVRILAKMVRAYLEAERRDTSSNPTQPDATTLPNPDASPSPSGTAKRTTG